MDDLDRRIISALQQNARVTTTKLAAQLGVARTTLHERISRLEEKSIIAGYTVVLRDPDERKKVMVKMLLEVQKKETSRIVARFKALPEISQCLSINGDYDLMITAEAPKLEDLDVIVEQVGSIPGVLRTQTLVVLGRRFDRNQSI